MSGRACAAASAAGKWVIVTLVGAAARSASAIVPPARSNTLEHKRLLFISRCKHCGVHTWRRSLASPAFSVASRAMSVRTSMGRGINVLGDNTPPAPVDAPPVEPPMDDAGEASSPLVLLAVDGDGSAAVDADGAKPVPAAPPAGGTTPAAGETAVDGVFCWLGGPAA